MTPGAVAVMVVLVTAGVAGVVVARRDRARLPLVAVVAALALVLVTTLLPTHPSAGSSGAQWEPVVTQGGAGTALRHLVAFNLDSAVQVVAILVVVYLPLGAALAWARPGRPRWLLLPAVVASLVEFAQYRWLDRVAAVDDVVIATGAALLGWIVVTWARGRVDGGRTTA